MHGSDKGEEGMGKPVLPVCWRGHAAVRKILCKGDPHSFYFPPNSHQSYASNYLIVGQCFLKRWWMVPEWRVATWRWETECAPSDGVEEDIASCIGLERRKVKAIIEDSGLKYELESQTPEQRKEMIQKLEATPRCLISCTCSKHLKTNKNRPMTKRDEQKIEPWGVRSPVKHRNSNCSSAWSSLESGSSPFTLAVYFYCPPVQSWRTKWISRDAQRSTARVWTCPAHVRRYFEGQPKSLLVTASIPWKLMLFNIILIISVGGWVVGLKPNCIEAGSFFKGGVSWGIWLKGPFANRGSSSCKTQLPLTKADHCASPRRQNLLPRSQVIRLWTARQAQESLFGMRRLCCFYCRALHWPCCKVWVSRVRMLQSGVFFNDTYDMRPQKRGVKQAFVPVVRAPPSVVNGIALAFLGFPNPLWLVPGSCFKAGHKSLQISMSLALHARNIVFIYIYIVIV